MLYQHIPGSSQDPRSDFRYRSGTLRFPILELYLGISNHTQNCKEYHTKYKWSFWHRNSVHSLVFQGSRTFSLSILRINKRKPNFQYVMHYL